MKAHTIGGGGNVQLHVEEAGREDGRPILFIHGFSHCNLTWRRQMDSDLSRRHRLVAMDLRGHGRSDKPMDAYADGRLWAEDVNAVIQELQLDRPVLVGWSYAGFVIADYLRYYGDNDIGGINFVGAAVNISADTAPDILGGDFLALLPGFFSTDVDESVEALQAFMRICGECQLDDGDGYLTLGVNTVVPPSVRQSLLSRTIDNDDVLPHVSVPVLVTQGERDRIVRPEVAREIAALVAGARISTYPEAGHAVFLDDTERFNRELAEFLEASAQVEHRLPTA